MKKTLLLLLLIAFPFSAFAQIREKLSPEDRAFYDYYAEVPTRLYGTMHTYQMKDTTDTPAPDGYKPFYVSHLGRHGSRYTYDPKIFRHLNALKQMKEENILNENGETLLAAYETFYSIMDGNWGELTAKGAAEHYGIGSRMAGRFPSVWEKGKLINVYATDVKRVRESRDNFLLGFNKACPCYQNFKVEVGTAVAKQATRGYYKPSDRKNNKYADSLRTSDNAKLKKILCDDGELTRRFFKKGCTPTEEQLKSFRKNLTLLYQREALDQENLPCLDTLVPFGELLYITAKDSNHWCHRHGLTTTNEGIGVKYQGLGIIHNILDEADQAITERKISASFRFSHDAFVLVLICSLGLDIYDYTLPTTESYRYNFISNLICLAGNIQLVFYEKEGQDILVKILHNEGETPVKDLKPVTGPYYRWDDLKKHICDREKEILARPAVKL